MTYDVCKRLIEIKDFKEDEKLDFIGKLDIFLLNDRINDKEYNELIGLINAK